MEQALSDLLRRLQWSQTVLLPVIGFPFSGDIASALWHDSYRDMKEGRKEFETVAEHELSEGYGESEGEGEGEDRRTKAGVR